MFMAIKNFFNSDDFMPHGHCFLWQSDIFWLHTISDGAIAAAYFTIPFALIYILRKRGDVLFESIFFLFAAFILFCGLTHAMSIWVLWHPDYAFEGVLKACTAIASIATLIVTVRLTPRIVAIPSPEKLVTVNRQLQEAGRELERLYHENKTNSESYLQAIVNTVLDGLITIDEHGIIQSFNTASVRIFGYLPEEVIGHNVKLLMPEPYHSGHDDYLHNYLNTSEAKVIGIGREITAKRKDGSLFPMELGVNEMHVIGKRMFVGTIRDITERKEAEKKSALLAAIVESSEDAIISRDIEGHIMTWNSGARHLLGYTDREAIGQHINLIIPQERRDEEEKIFSYVSAGNPVKHMETLRRSKEGRYIDVSLSVSPLYDKNQKITGASKIIRDITERKNTEREREKFMLSLKRSNQELDDFAHIASHDLKEPLRGLSNNALFLKEDYAGRIGADGVKRLERMIYLCERMERLVNDLLYFSRLGRQDLAVQPTDLHEVIQDIASMMETTLRETNTTIRINGILPVIVCDLPRITEAFRNLITNAVKYNDKKDKLVEIGCVEQKGEWQFYVRDNGIGIPPQFHEDVFRIFKRLNDDEDGVKGTGVGLTFVKKIIERHNGRIWIESEANQGTTFFFTINHPKESD